MGVVADVFQTVLIDTDGNAIGTTSLTESNIEVSVQENDIRYGRGNQLAGILHSDRDITLNFTEGEFKYDWLAMQLGQDITTGEKIGWAMPKWYEVVDNNSTLEVTLDHAPLASDSGIKIFDEDGVAVTGTVSGSKVTFTTGVSGGDKVEVRTYKYNTAATTQEIEIDNSVFAKGVQVVMETLEIDPQTEEPIATIQYIFDRALPSGSFTVNTASERTAQTQAFSLRVVKPKTSTVVGRILRIPIE